MTQLTPSPFDPRYWGCPRCGWPLNPADDPHDLGGITCACGAWVVFPDPPIPPIPPTEEVSNE